MRRRPMAPSLLTMLRDSVATPAEAAERLLALRPRTGTIIEAAILVSVLDALLLGVLTGGRFAVPLPSGDVSLPPLLHAGILFGSLLLFASAIQVGGRLLGGQGRFAEALLVVVWLEVLAILVELALLVVGLLFGPVAGLLGLVGLAVLLWCLLHFTRALHGFPGLGRTALALLLGSLVAGVALSLVLGALGFGAVPDV